MEPSNEAVSSTADQPLLTTIVTYGLGVNSRQFLTLGRVYTTTQRGTLTCMPNSTITLYDAPTGAQVFSQRASQFQNAKFIASGLGISKCTSLEFTLQDGSLCLIEVRHPWTSQGLNE